jgi:hypothetical protein
MYGLKIISSLLRSISNGHFHRVRENVIAERTYIHRQNPWAEASCMVRMGPGSVHIRFRSQGHGQGHGDGKGHGKGAAVFGPPGGWVPPPVAPAPPPVRFAPPAVPAAETATLAPQAPGSAAPDDSDAAECTLALAATAIPAGTDRKAEGIPAGTPADTGLTEFF